LNYSILFIRVRSQTVSWGCPNLKEKDTYLIIAGTNPSTQPEIVNMKFTTVALLAVAAAVVISGTGA
jgi:hypothetical protein